MRDLIDFEDRTVIVAGGASGIGHTTAKEFAEEGASIVIADIDADGARDVGAEIEDEFGEDALAAYTDLSDYTTCEETVRDAIDEFGTVDVLVNTATGRGPGHSFDKFHEEDPNDWSIELDVTFRGVLNMSHAVLDPMIEQERGVILNTSSESAKGQDPGLAVYAGTKAGIIGFSKTLAKEVGEYDIRVNVVSPGTTRTPATEGLLEKNEENIVPNYPLRRIGEPEDQANAFVFLASDAATWITGQTLSVNGGYL